MKYTKEQFLKAAELGEVSMIDAKHICSLLDEIAPQLPQQEISDEEIEEEISKRYMHPTQDYAWRDACKWYREQLKTKI